MWKYTLLLIVAGLAGRAAAGPLGLKKNMPILQREDESSNAQPAAALMMEASEEPKPATTASAGMPMMSTLTLPSNATSIRADITDGFSCANKTYGYYADVENDCQIFHVCLPVTYADGKENTFRWSFICPEETIFSQESFTCMRPEDMTIDCEESFKYYELNRNFGMIDEEPKKNTASGSANPPNQMDEDQSAMSSQQPDQQVPAEEEKVVVVQPTVSAPVSAPMPAQVQPMKPSKPSKPVKMPKPNRRKPAQKRPSENSPLHKILQVVPTVPKITIAQTEHAAPVDVETKPVHHRYTKRPSTMSTVIKEKIQPAYSQKNKRPTYFHKTNAAPTKPQEEAANETVKPELTEPVPTLKLETMFAVTQSQQEAMPINTPAEKTESAGPTKEAVEISEPAAQASEPAVIFVKPEEPETAIKDESLMMATKNENAMKMDTVKEALAVEGDAVKENAVEVETAVKEETNQMKAADKDTTKTNLTKEQTMGPSTIVVSEKKIIPANDEEPIGMTMPIKETSTAMEAIIPSLVEVVDPEESKIVQNNQTPIEAYEEIPAVIIETEEPSKSPTVEVNTPIEMAATNTAPVEHSQKIERIETLSAFPKIFEENSEEVMTAPLVEELEEAKPVNAIETMPAEPTMEQHSAIVQQMFPESEDDLHSMGSFKPVDPHMAAEAEALITQFLNTLKKADTTNSEVIMPGHSAHNEMAEIQSEQQGMDTENTGMEEAESQKNIVIADTRAEKQPEAPVMKESSENVQGFTANEPTILENAAPISMIKLHTFPDEMYQIPVQIIETTADNQENFMPAKEQIKAEEPTITEPQAASYAPISIDDIVELVKERLDQVPATEQETVAKSDEIQGDQSPAHGELKSEAVTVAEKPISEQSAEEIIMPIYHRVSELETPSLKILNTLTAEEKPTLVELKSVETEGGEQTVQAEKIEEPAVQIETDTPAIIDAADPKIQTKANRAYRSRSIGHAKMDPRKRRFLFRSDVR